ncbi:hypothetical protein PRIPAC_75752 [Pristionchus pacificus]|uniref:F-box domain-containing protein n=1 Tax=Pristionchus pacificus TaxID=54126 RepID=A0A2A6C6R8_PRIPA|nr:hypothetical protein PRIPAC_75752 [Pristionchus pacificus]|eukprot:PDM73875.1 hypothetical protein PRIPAC_41231 [Pristionchus pacificus]
MQTTSSTIWPTRPRVSSMTFAARRVYSSRRLTYRIFAYPSYSCPAWSLSRQAAQYAFLVLLNGCFQSDQLRSIYYAFKRTTCCPSKSALTLLPLHLPVKLSNMESLPNLPNEIWSSIIEYLSADDRKSIASVDNKFQALEGKTGYRRFVNVKIASINDDDISATARSTVIEEKIPSNEIIPFLIHATTDKLEIAGRMNEQAEMKVKDSTKTLKFKTLDLEICDDRSYGLMNELIRGKDNTNEVVMRLNIADGDAKMDNSFLLDLPSIDKVNIYETINNEFFINDEMLINLARISSSWLSINILHSDITATGLASIFEMMYISREKKMVICYAQFMEFFDFFEALRQDSRFALLSSARVAHIATGATFSYDQASAIPQPEESCQCILHFCSANSVPELESLLPN